jgi:DNA-binding transcriptional MerR regulator
MLAMRTFALHQFLDETSLPERTLRHWHKHGIVPQAVDGLYNDEHLMRVRAAMLLQDEGVRRLSEIVTQLDAMSPRELREYVGFVEDEAEEEAAAPTVEAPAPAPAPVPEVDKTLPAMGAVGVSKGAHVEEHVEITLKPGMVLRLRKPIGEETRTLVQSIASLCGTTVELRA